MATTLRLSRQICAACYFEATLTTDREKALHANYGFDAPGLIRTCFAVSLGMALLGFAVAGLVPVPAIARISGALIIAASLLPLALGLSLLAYGRAGKLRVRDVLLDLVPWTGAEAVLDVGTGRGLMLIGAAKRLTTGRVTGVDVWNTSDLSGNSLGNLKRNIDIEGVASRTDVMTADARKLPFPDASFDVIFSLLCLHNIHDAAGRRAACQEMARVLKPGGIALIGDYAGAGDYAAAFVQAGLRVYPRISLTREALSLMSVVHVRRHGIAGASLPARSVPADPGPAAPVQRFAAAISGTVDA